MSPDLSRRADSRAVLIGVASYGSRGYRSVPAATNSLDGMFGVLTDPALGGWSRERVTVIRDPDGPVDLAVRLRKLAKETTGAFLLYYVGHGALTDAGELCLVLSETDPDHLEVTGLEYSRVRAALLGSPARTKIVILDCCFSGRVIDGLAGGAGQLADFSELSGAYTLTAADRVAHVPPLAQQSGSRTSFTGELLDLVRDGIPGAPRELTFEQIYGPLRHRLRSKSLPSPNQRQIDNAGKFVFCRNSAAATTPQAVRPELHGAGRSAGVRSGPGLPPDPEAGTAGFRPVFADFLGAVRTASTVHLQRAATAWSHLTIDSEGLLRLDFPVEQPSAATLTIKALVSRLGPNRGYAPIDIVVNHEVLFSRNSLPDDEDYPHEVRFSVNGDHLRSGVNTLELRVVRESRSLFWLYHVLFEPTSGRGKAERAMLGVGAGHVFHADFSGAPQISTDAAAVRCIGAEHEVEHWSFAPGSSVALDFLAGDSGEEMSVRVQAIAPSDSPCFFDVVVNGETTSRHRVDPGGSKVGETALAIPGRLLRGGVNTFELRTAADARSPLWLYRIIAGVAPARH
jgi:hypothetical protein